MVHWKKRGGTQVGQSMLDELSRLSDAQRFIAFRLQEAYTSKVDPSRRWEYESVSMAGWHFKKKRKQEEEGHWTRANKQIWAVKRHPKPGNEPVYRNRDVSAVISMIMLLFGEASARNGGYGF